MKRKDFKYLYPFLIMLLPAFSLLSCNQQQTSAAENRETAQDEVETLKQEVMAVHDETMSWLGTLMHLKKQLKEKAVQLDTADADSKENAMALQLTIKQLEEADEAMMEWMHTYQDPDQTMEKVKALGYLELKKKEILQVKEKIEASEAAAKSKL
ncbi:hypothetical protein MKJ04_19940 [Pontibacter sp. E15-1]|uniref:hypothetical protein n=1 Tax=Pontibacter sp. E15-1 TaxID=2919918 RepID=UPI001F503F66|nr:hypothetical protein [Pontibacter sp. E15-1]MCJ8167122.1 hypothetical protein [Pontibacter sp. E15-1]